MMGRVKEYYFEEISRYPVEPGYKEPTTSRDAAKQISERSRFIRDRAWLALHNVGLRGLTADEISSRIGETILATRPRITELKLLGKIERTGERRANASGVKAAVWRVKI